MKNMICTYCTQIKSEIRNISFFCFVFLKKSASIIKSSALMCLSECDQPNQDPPKEKGGGSCGFSELVAV